jgi:hypothetical protein
MGDTVAQQDAAGGRLTSNTKTVSTRAPAQASTCQDSYGLPANWFITTGTEAIGWKMLLFSTGCRRR